MQFMITDKDVIKCQPMMGDEAWCEPELINLEAALVRANNFNIGNVPADCWYEFSVNVHGKELYLDDMPSLTDWSIVGFITIEPEPVDVNEEIKACFANKTPQ